MSKREASAPCTYSGGSEVVMGVLDSAAYDPPRAFVRITGGDDLVNPHVADLLRAVSEAFDVKVVPDDAIVIEAKRVPAVLHRPDGMYEVGEVVFDGSATAGHYERRAMEHLAIAEHLRANPPVDEAEVQRLTKVLCDVEMDHPDGPVPHVIARRLYLAGVRAPEVTK